MDTELEFLIQKYEKLPIPVAASILRDLGINPDAPVGTTKHHMDAYPKMMDTALPIFKREASTARHDYPHIPCGVFQHIKDTEPK